MKNKKFIITTSILIVVIIMALIVSNHLNNIRLNNIKQEQEISNDKSVLEVKDEFDNVVGTYGCKYENCSFIKTTVDNDSVFESLSSTEKEYNTLINNRYIFINDYNNEKDKKVIIYDIVNNKSIMNVDNIKNYDIDLEDNYFIYEENQKYGLLQLNDTVKVIIKPNYEYLGVANNVDTSTNKLIVDKLVVSNENKWSIIDLSGNELSLVYENPIVNYNGLYIITLENDKYKLYNYDGKKYFENSNFDYINFTAKYVNFVENGYLKIIDPETNKILVSNVKLTNKNYKFENSFSTRIENNKLIVTVIGDNDNKEYTFNL